MIGRLLEAPEHVRDLVQSRIKHLTIMAVEAELNKTTEDVPQTRDEWWCRTKDTMVQFAPFVGNSLFLTSFSITLFAYFPTAQCENRSIMDSFSSILDALPSTLRSLTIDSCGDATGEIDLPDDDKIHFCLLLFNQSFWPNLHHLRIRARYICSSMFTMLYSGQCDQLETITINLSLGTQDFTWLTKDFSTRSCISRLSNPQFSWMKLGEASKDAVSRLPRLKRFLVIRHFWPDEEYNGLDVCSDMMVRFPLSIDWKSVERPKDDEIKFIRPDDYLPKDSIVDDESSSDLT